MSPVTAIKSVIAYVADYITKTPLKTHVMFQSIQQVFERNVELLGSQKSTKEKARSLITKIVNSLTKTSNQKLEADSAPKPKKSRSKYVQFHENHPQYETHHVKLLDESEAYVPNFIGGSLPSNVLKIRDR